MQLGAELDFASPIIRRRLAEKGIVQLLRHTGELRVIEHIARFQPQFQF
jgi:hypothetical protein